MRNAVEDKFMAGIALYAGYDVLHFGDRLLAVPTETLQGIPFRGHRRPDPHCTPDGSICAANALAFKTANPRPNSYS